MDELKKNKILFRKMVDYLVEIKRFSLKAIAEVTGVPYAKIRNIRYNRSSPNMEMIKIMAEKYPDLASVFPELAERFVLKDDKEIQNRIEQLETDNRLIKELMVKLLIERGDNRTAEQIKKLI